MWPWIHACASTVICRADERPEDRERSPIAERIMEIIGCGRPDRRNPGPLPHEPPVTAPAHVVFARSLTLGSISDLIVADELSLRLVRPGAGS